MTMGSLGDVALKLQDGPFGSNLKSSHYTDEGVRVVRLQNIGSGFFDDSDQAFISPAHFAKLQKHECSAGDVLVATLGDPILLAAIQPKSLPVTLNKADCIQLRCDPDRAVAGYVTHYLNSGVAQSHASALAHGQTRKRVNLSQLRRLPIPLPPIEEQRRIAAVLDAADALRAKRRQAIAKLDTLTQAIFIDMFSRNGWDSWPSQPVESVANPGKGAIRTGPFGSQLLHEEFVDDGVAVLGIDNAVQNRFAWGKRRFITEKKYAQLSRFTVSPGDVLVTIMGTCGRVAVVPNDIPRSINTKHLCCVTVNKEVCLPEWLWACLRFHPAVLDQLGATHGAVMPGLNMGKIKQAEIPVPPLNDQRRFAERMAATVYHQEVSDRSRVQVETLFASLQQRAFRGEL